jgi:hypothetical protein
MPALDTRLGRLARGEVPAAAPAAAPPQPAPERCELCGAPVAPEHRHVVDTHSRQLLCACRACVIVFDSEGAGGGHFRLVPEHRRRIADFDLDDALWQGLQIPVDMAFFFRSTPAGRVVAFYPGPMGAAESQLELDAWAEIEAANPVLQTMAPDVEALLVDRAQGRRNHWLVPIDDCYSLVGLIRSRWRGLSGGAEVWEEIERFFAGLERQAVTVNREELA